ncbi:MAG TPA: TIGR03619 family F420-dependent LLM class oxidoreductase, partial [Acidimicrobiales bacterium]|nr:TIGR03619 family F420-dependent LLM class oxidoreductase [Acidimicrobiales bacterium]
MRSFVEAAEALGYDHILIYDHVVGSHPRKAKPDWPPRYFTHEDPFHEPLTLFAWIAGLTTHVQLMTGVLVLPQRQTVLVAKQAAEVDLLSGGRLQLGVGLGWNQYEYESLGVSFTARGARIDEQIHVLRLLWTEELVDYQGTYHRLDDVGINPLPVQRPIPVWIGGMSDA